MQKLGERIERLHQDINDNGVRIVKLSRQKI